MAKNKNQRQPNETAAGTNVQKVKKQNQQGQQPQEYGQEFAQETNAQEVKRRNQQAEQKKNQQQKPQQ